MGAGCSRDDTEKLDKFTGATPVVKPAAQTDNRQTVVVDKHTDSYAENKGNIYIYILSIPIKRSFAPVNIFLILK